MSRSYIAIFPSNPLSSNPDRNLLISRLKESGFIAEEDYEWKNPETNSLERYYRPGKKYKEFFTLFDVGQVNVEEELNKTLIDFKEHDKIELEVYGPGEFIVINPETGSTLGESWADELGEFLDKNDHKWIDPINNKAYYFFELQCSDLALGRHFITIEEGWGEPNLNLMQLLQEITGQEYKWIWTKV